MTQEQKAQRYDEAIDIARKINSGEGVAAPSGWTTCEVIFPELRESEDERIRKELLEHCKNQAKPYIQTGNKCPQIQSWIDWLEKQGEQKSADKVEPKFNFNVGQWIVTGKCTYLITKIKDFDVTLVDTNGNEYVFDTYSLRDAHLYTIQDAKDGDVLSYRDGQWIFIYKEKIDDNSFCYYALYSTIHQDLTINDAGFTLLGDAITPATKERRDQLEKAMTDAGYTFDFEKKELRKIEQKPAWSEEDERNLNDAILFIETGTYSLDKDNLINWLKSLRPQNRWKPSEEQMNILFKYAEQNNKDGSILTSLYQDLKKLKGRESD